MGGMGGAQPLAATMNGACFLGIDVDRSRIEKRIRTSYCDRIADNLDDALRLLDQARRAGEALSVGLVGNCADVIPELVSRNAAPDIVTDQTSAHDPLNGYVPNGLSPSEAAELREKNPDDYVRRSLAGWRAMSKACWLLSARERSSSITAITSGSTLSRVGRKAPLKFPALCRNTFDRCSARDVARSGGPLLGHPADIYRSNT